ncbi:hypothetical protein [Streptomyces prunicolor]|uniref:HEAT repeat domain-containing protein n=1 Tax=Streptomyces prunicolor TaxID=67348 RepID=A0ABU4FTH7_9ACTN|nr:hypothetical protein [Streptomyces prunicolor]MDV7222575.1 hypothetical protein [Streptomyces prunicolor]
MDEKMDGRDPLAWLRLDEMLRCEPYAPAWLAEPELAIELCHRDGRIREAALQQAVGCSELLPLVVVRCADWVEQVRERARELLRASLDVETGVALAPLILLFGRRGRGAFAIELVGGVLRPASREQLAPLFVHPDRAVRRFVHRLAVEEGLLSPGELARAAARDTDAVVQNLCAEAALAAVAKTGGYDEVLEPLLGARNPRARATGVTALRAAGLTERAEGFLADRSGVVRACARYVVRQGGGDPLALYRARCLAAEPAPGAVIGLAECGGRGDAEVLWGFVGHPAAALRARAVAGLRLLDVVDVRRMLPLLDDPAPGVMREATLALLPSAGLVPDGPLMERLAGGWPKGWPRHVRVGAFRLLDARGGIVRLRAAVTVLDDPDEKVRAWGARVVQRWHLEEGMTPGDPEVGELLGRARHLFSEYVLSRRLWEAGLPG